MSISQLSERAMIYSELCLINAKSTNWCEFHRYPCHCVWHYSNIIDILLVSVSVLSSIYNIHNFFTIPSEMFMKAQKGFSVGENLKTDYTKKPKKSRTSFFYWKMKILSISVAIRTEIMNFWCFHLIFCKFISPPVQFQLPFCY